MNLWEERAGRNEALFREVNEHVEALSEGSVAGETGFVCECSDAGCTARLYLRLAVYESARADPRRFLVVPGHEGDFERIVERGDGYVVVEKEGGAGRISEQTDPRS
jgi:hypothetical protein